LYTDERRRWDAADREQGAGTQADATVEVRFAAAGFLRSFPMAGGLYSAQSIHSVRNSVPNSHAQSNASVIAQPQFKQD
jgi:hypothetical protein